MLDLTYLVSEPADLANFGLAPVLRAALWPAVQGLLGAVALKGQSSLFAGGSPRGRSQSGVTVSPVVATALDSVFSEYAHKGDEGGAADNHRIVAAAERKDRDREITERRASGAAAAEELNRWRTKAEEAEADAEHWQEQAVAIAEQGQRALDEQLRHAALAPAPSPVRKPSAAVVSPAVTAAGCRSIGVQAFHSELPSFKKALDDERLSLDRESAEVKRKLQDDNTKTMKQLLHSDRRHHQMSQRYNAMLNQLVEVGNVVVSLKVAHVQTARTASQSLVEMQELVTSTVVGKLQAEFERRAVAATAKCAAGNIVPAFAAELAEVESAHIAELAAAREEVRSSKANEEAAVSREQAAARQLERCVYPTQVVVGLPASVAIPIAVC